MMTSVLFGLSLMALKTAYSNGSGQVLIWRWDQSGSR